MRRCFAWTFGVVVVLVVGLNAAAQEQKAHFSVVSAAFKADRDSGTISVTVKNEGDVAGSATVKVRRERSRCVELDESYCRENPPAPGATCEPPCRRWETTLLGSDEKETGVVASGREAVITIEVPNEAAYAEISVAPGGNLGFGVEISGPK